jgi:hypothetical protein
LAHEQHVKITTVHADLSTYEPEAESLTGIVAIFAHLPPVVRKRVHAWTPRALRPGGVFILEAYTPQQLALNTGGPRNPALLMSLADLREEVSPLTIEIGREVERQIDEGSFHAGTSATVQVVAVRPLA